MNYFNSKIYSIGNDAKLTVASLQDNNFYQEVLLPFNPIAIELKIKSEVIYFASNNKEVHVYDANLLENIRLIQVDTPSVLNALEVSDSGEIIVGDYEGYFCIYSSNYELQYKLHVAAKINCIKYCNNREIIAIGDNNGIVSLWNKHGEAILMWKPHETITCIDIDDHRIATAGMDSLVKIWSI